MRNEAFLATAIAVDASATKVNGTDFTSRELGVLTAHGLSACGILVTFTRAAGSTSKLTLEFQASNDLGTTWTTEELIKIEIETQAEADGDDKVRHLTVVEIGGFTHLRLSKVVNGDAANNVTAVNATLVLTD